MNMDVSKKTYGSNNQEKKRVSIKSGGGVGIGAVVMFGGALATAALASAFVFKRRGPSSAEERRGQSPEIKMQSEKEEEMRTVSVDDETDTSLHAQKHRSEDVKENFETCDDSRSLSSQDELPGIETSVGILDAADAKNDEILRLTETDDSMVKNDLQLDEKLSIDLNVSMEEAKVQLQDEDSLATVLNSNGNCDAELVTVDEYKGGEVSEMNDEFDPEIKDMQSTEEEDEDGDGDAVVIKKMQVIPDNSKPKLNSGKVESDEVVHIDNMEAHNAEETGLEEDDDQKHIKTLDKREFQVPELEEDDDEAEEFISPRDIQDKSCDLDSVSPGDNIQDKGCDLENSYQIYVEKTIKEDGIGEKGEDIISYEEDETDSSELHSSEQSVDSSKESNSEAIWPAEDLQELTSIEPQEVKLFSDREVEGKLLEDKAAKERAIHESKGEDVHFKADKQRFENNNLVQKETTKDLRMSSTKRRLAIAILLTLSSISVSLIFDMSLMKLCFISFLTMLLSEMNAYRTI